MLLPLSGKSIGFREPDGEHEAVLAEQPPWRPVASGILLLSRLARTDDGRPLDAGALALTDFEAALAGLRTHLAGPDASSQATCRCCGTQVELGFSLDALAATVSPRSLPGASVAPGGGEIDGIRFRLPTAADLDACEGAPDAEERLWHRCVDRPVAPQERRRVERAIARMAPLLSRIVSAPCIACRASLRVLLHIPSFVVGELAWAARSVFQDVHLIASTYGWREAEILAMPSVRRRRYAASIREGP